MKKFLALKLLMLLNSIISYGQCAMCKAVVEADLESGGSKGAGLNNGILYLIATPYLLIFCFGLFYILQKRKKAQSA